jgi:colicin import membrane protein
VAAESARRAILRCQPYRLPIAKYDVWKDVEVNFDPRDMFRG